MKPALFICALLLLAPAVWCQQRFEIVSGRTTNLKPYYSKTRKLYVDTVDVWVRLSGVFKPTENKLVLDVEAFNLPNKPQLLNETFDFKPTDWPGEKNSREVAIPVLIVTESFSDTLKNDEMGHIIIKGRPDQFHTIRLTNALVTDITRYDPNKAFWLEVGSNFDLIDGPVPNNFFSGVFLYKRDIQPIFTKDSAKRLGVFAGVFESKSITAATEQNFSFREYYDSSSFIPNIRDSMRVFRGVGSIVNRRTVRNLGLFFSPQMRITRRSANEDGLHVSVAFWMELQWQRIEEETDFAQLRKVDSSVMRIDSVLSSSRYNAKNPKKERDVRSHYFGFGVPVFYRETVGTDLIHLFVNPIIGISNQPTQQFLDEQFLALSDPKLVPPRRPWSPFYAIQFRLNEENYGISFTGEVRGLLRRANPPFVSIALSKKFDLTKFIEYNK